MWSTTELSEPEASATLTSSTDKRDLAERVARRRGTEVEVLAHHVAHDPLEVDVFRLGRCHYRSVAQHHDIVGNLQRLFEMMRDVDDRHAAAGQVADHPEQHLHFGRAQRGRRLVHDQDARVHRESARDLDDLLLSQTQILHQGHWVDLFLEIGYQRAHLTRLLGEIDAGRGAQLSPHENVVTHAEVWRQAHLLMDDRDPAIPRLRGGGEGDATAVELDEPGCRRHDAGQNIHQRRLAGAILS